MRNFILFCMAILIAGCAGHQNYARPTTNPKQAQNVKEISKSRDAVWVATVPELGKRFFVINNLDKSSGLINVSYSGDPEKYVDCGRITSHVQNARGERTYNFAGSSAQQTYEVLNTGVGLFSIDRRMSLEGRVNLIFEEVGPDRTRVTANTRYVVSRQRNIRSVGNNTTQNLSDSIQFNSGSGSTFPGAADQALDCVATGLLEREILDAIR